MRARRSGWCERAGRPTISLVSRGTLDRRTFLGLGLGALAGVGCGKKATEGRPAMNTPSPLGRMPVVFIGHGSPMNAIEDNAWSQAFRSLGEKLPRPRAILSVSAHWYIPGTFVTGNDAPPTLHDFGGFPRALFEMQYPARGDAALARRVSELLARPRGGVSNDWGLDHGTWSVLHHLRPAADVPVLQLSIDRRLPAAEHTAIGRALAPLRDEGILVLGSGNVTHNLGDYFESLQAGRGGTAPWAAAFDRDIAAALEQHDTGALERALTSDDGRKAHPSPDHYLPLLYAAGAADDKDTVTFPITGFDRSLSMRAVRMG